MYDTVHLQKAEMLTKLGELDDRLKTQQLTVVTDEDDVIKSTDSAPPSPTGDNEFSVGYWINFDCGMSGGQQPRPERLSRANNFAHTQYFAHNRRYQPLISKWTGRKPCRCPWRHPECRWNLISDLLCQHHWDLRLDNSSTKEKSRQRKQWKCYLRRFPTWTAVRWLGTCPSCGMTQISILIVISCNHNEQHHSGWRNYANEEDAKETDQEGVVSTRVHEHQTSTEARLDRHAAIAS